jgi:hypothetical protein
VSWLFIELRLYVEDKAFGGRFRGFTMKSVGQIVVVGTTLSRGKSTRSLELPCELSPRFPCDVSGSWRIYRKEVASAPEESVGR